MTHAEKTEIATFAGGCFWCMEPPFEQLPGVQSVTAGYIGGKTANPAYEEVCSGRTGHAEAVQVVYDPAVIPYSRLLDAFWQNVDPTQDDGQFADRGTQYRTAIFYHSPDQKQQAEASKKALAASGRFSRPIMTTLEPAATFYRAEDYHQDYYRKNALRYKAYRIGSGREDFLEKIWGQKAEKS